MPQGRCRAMGERVHGKALCWTARISGIALSLVAAVCFIYYKVELDSGPLAVPIAMWFLGLTVAPALAACWWHRAGGAFMLIVCLLYAEGASVIVEEEVFFRVALPYAVVWAASGVLHLVVPRLEGRRAGA